VYLFRERRRPERSTLHRVVRENLPVLVDAARDPDTGTSRIPRFVLRELEGYVACGLLSRGFLRAVCGTCGTQVLVAFSCKGRALCPSCATRRTEDTTEHIISRVLPDAPLRQFVLSLPFELRGRVAYDSSLFAAVVRIFVSEVFGLLRRKASVEIKSRARTAKCGAIACLQRFGYRRS
jgi:hypothetical protein